MTKPIIGVLGAGSIGTRHMDNLLRLGYLVIFYDPFTENSIGKDRDFILDKSDKLLICSPIKEHYADLMDCLATGKPVFCEKPLAHIGHGSFTRVAMVGYNLRYHPCVQAAKAWMESGAVGHVHWANFTCGQYNDKYREAGEGVILNWSHEIDLAIYLLGNANVLSAHVVAEQPNIETIAHITMGHPQYGCLTTVQLDYVSIPQLRQFVIIGERAQVICDLHHRQTWLRAPDGEMIDHDDASDTSFDDDYVAEIEAFASGNIEPNAATGAQALAVLNICNDARRIAGLDTVTVASVGRILN